MAALLNREEYRRLFDEDIKWLMKQLQTLERDHICKCLIWLRDTHPAGWADSRLVEKQSSDAEEKQQPMTKDVFELGQKVIVSMPNGEEKVGRVFGTEPGECLRKPIEGTAYIIKFEDPSLREWEKYTSVGPEKLKAASALRGR